MHTNNKTSPQPLYRDTAHAYPPTILIQTHTRINSYI